MAIRTCSAALILALSYSSLGAAPAAGSLAILARAYRRSPSPARRSALSSYLAGHPQDAALVHPPPGFSANRQNKHTAATAPPEPPKGKTRATSQSTAP